MVMPLSSDPAPCAFSPKQSSTKENSQSESHLDPDEIVYTSLIQTYLGLLCYENASFLAERLVAHRPLSEHAIYMLAYCYYRNGSPKRARNVLLSRWRGRNDFDPSPNLSENIVIGEGKDAAKVEELERTRSSVRYLLAKCCYDLGLYGEAEEALLCHCREIFGRLVSSGGGVVGGIKVRGNMNEAMDAWVLQTTPCPVPNGPAGLHLLGNICRKSSRRQRAIDYYRLSLKLDPLMWSSYEAMCELGGPPGSTDEADDPNSIFGVPAPVLSPRNEDPGIMVRHAHPFLPVVKSPDSTPVDGSTGEDLYSFKINQYGTPSTPYSGFNRLKIGVSYTNNNSHLHTEGRTGEMSGAHHFHRPATASTIASRARARNERLPQTNLFNATPSISEQETSKSSIREGPSLSAATPANSNAAPSSAIGYADEVLDRARRVVAGMYYEPSPEATKPGFTDGLPFSGYSSLQKGTSRRNIEESFKEISKIEESTTRHIHVAPSGADLSFASTPPKTPHGDPSPFNAGVSSVKGEKRALFPANDDTTSRKRAVEENKKITGQEFDVAPAEDKKLDVGTESKHVGKVLKLLCTLGAGYKYLCQYRSQEALEVFRELQPSQTATGWVQHQIGKAYFEMSDYPNAQRALEHMQRVEPHRMKGLDILSTSLWHLKKEVELSDLAQRAIDFDRLSPEAWFVVGNCFSFQKEHETAITFFRRSIQLNPTYTYAHTLCGHEYMSNEDFEKAVACYRDAIRVDSQHYNAWYGLGAIYYRQEKFDLAEYHFQRALDINHQSSVLYCHLGMAQHSNGKTFEALETLSGAFRLDPRNPQAHYQRATIFMTLDRPQEALEELEKVRSSAPKEASVHFNMGKVLKRLGQPEKAMRCFLTALDLDPKDNNLIKAAMDRLDEPDVEEEVSVF